MTDSVGTVEPNVSLVMLDLRGDTLFSLTSDTSGTIPTQTITRAIYDYSYQSGDERGPHTFKIKKFGKTFITQAKQFAAATIDTLQVSDNPFVTLTEAQVLNLTGISYSEPTKVNYGNEINSSWTTTGTLTNNPITQSEFFSVFGNDGTSNDTKLTLVTDTPNANGEYSINYETGILTFFNNQSGYNVTPVYSHGGNITIATGTVAANCISMSDLYSYMQYNLSDVLTTVDGVAYVPYVDMVIGNSTTGGCIVDSAASLSFEDGYTYSFSSIGGYIDLYGVTAGSGSGGGLPLNIFDDTASTYNPTDEVYIFSTVLDSDGDLVSATVNTTAYYPNDTIISTGLSTETSTGRFRYNFTLPSGVIEGTYHVDIDATYSTDEVHDTLVFTVENATSGGSAYPTITLQAATPIATSTTTGIGALITSSTGVPVNCDGNLNLTIKNMINGSIMVASSTMSNAGTGIYNYSWATPTDASVFYINSSCAVSGTSYTGTTLVSTQSIAAPTATIDYNQIATYVWAYGSRNLTYYNQSVAENIESCLQDGACSNWWIDTTLTSINNTLNVINTTVDNLGTDSDTLLNYFDCTTSNEICGRLNNITNNVTDIQSRVETLNTTQIPNLQTDINNIYTDTQWLYTNVATQTNISEVITIINNLQTNITYIKNNMFYQGNATGAFIVDYLATPYIEADTTDRAETWMVTTDLLGNAKTVSAATCEVWKQGSFVANGTTNINSGGVTAYWDAPSTANGEYYWNCTLTGSTINVKIPFYVSGPTFEITSLTTSSPKYPDEAALIEATFALENGTDVEPDTIDIRIHSPPTYATTWATGNKTNFQQIGNVWRYTNTIESNPTTGTYIAHVNATYNGIEASEAIQFRIATGGPYMVVLACPSSSAVGSSLDCNVIIQDEGEAATESTCNVWVDTNGDETKDPTEPQNGFSKETLPLDNITQPISINVPSTHSTGNYVTWVSCSYANSAQPDSTASDTVTLSAAASPGDDSTGGGGGGGAGAVITPTPKEKKEAKEPFAFEVKVEVLPKYKEILLGDNILVADILIESIGTEKKIDNVNLEYFIENSRGRTFFTEREQINLDTETILLRDLEIGEDLGIGPYWFTAKVSYKEAGALGKDNFYVVEEKGLIETRTELPKIDIITIIILLLLLILILVIIRAFIKKRRDPKVIHIHHWHHHKHHKARARRAKKILKAARKKHAKKSRENRFLALARKRKEAKEARISRHKTEIGRKLFKGKSKSQLLGHLKNKHAKATKEKEDLKKLMHYIKDEV